MGITQLHPKVVYSYRYWNHIWYKFVFVCYHYKELHCHSDIINLCLAGFSLKCHRTLKSSGKSFEMLAISESGEAPRVNDHSKSNHRCTSLRSFGITKLSRKRKKRSLNLPNVHLSVQCDDLPEPVWTLPGFNERSGTGWTPCGRIKEERARRLIIPQSEAWSSSAVVAYSAGPASTLCCSLCHSLFTASMRAARYSEGTTQWQR